MPTLIDHPGNVTTLPRGGRDGFIADTAIRLDRLEAAVSRLEKDGENARTALIALLENAEQTKRLRTYEESLRNSREYKIDEVLRTSRDLKARIDRIEGDRPATGVHAYPTFEAVNKRLQELGRLETEIVRAEIRARRSTGVLYAVLAVLAVTAAAYLMPGNGLI